MDITQKVVLADSITEDAISAIKSKIHEIADENFDNKVKLAVSVGLQKNYFTDLKKKKDFKLSELVKFSLAFDYDFISLIKLQIEPKKEMFIKEKRVKIAVTLEVTNEADERVILEKLLDKQAVKKLIG